MKLLSILKVAFATMLLFTLTSAKTAKERPSSNNNEYYYWYLDGGTVYDDWTSVSSEITRLETEYGVLVDTNPNGTLIASGYFVKGYPHLVYASVLLYSH
jgi:hypothetical protein